MAGFKINLKNLIILRANKTGEILTQADVQNATGIAQATLSRWYNGATVERLDYNAVVRLMQFFKCDLCDLVSVETSEDNE